MSWEKATPFQGSLFTPVVCAHHGKGIHGPENGKQLVTKCKEKVKVLLVDTQYLNRPKSQDSQMTSVKIA